MASKRSRPTERLRPRTPRARTLANPPVPAAPKRYTARVSPSGEVRIYPETRLLKERPFDGNERATRAVTELVELAAAGEDDGRKKLLSRLLESLFRLIVDGSESGYFADAPLTVESIAELLLEHLIHENRGLRVPEPGAIAIARLLRVIARWKSLSRTELDRVASAAKVALGASDPRALLVAAMRSRDSSESFASRSQIEHSPTTLLVSRSSSRCASTKSMTPASVGRMWKRSVRSFGRSSIRASETWSR